jgi:hypothetical protein
MSRVPILVLLLLAAACQQPAPPAPPPAPSAPETSDACLRRVLAEAKLNAFGDPPDTMYAGGSPLFNEATGQQTPLRTYVAAKHPELVARCP